MSLDKNESLEIVRGAKCAGTFVKGIFTADGGHNVDIEASVQPLTGSELMQLPEGDRVKQPLFISSDDEIQGNDTFCRDGLVYEVLKVENWSHSSLNPHYEAVALLQGA